MKRLILTVCVALLGLSCGGKREVAKEEGPTVRAVDVRVEPDHRKLTVIWEKQGEGMISGYNIYISQSPLASVSGPYPPPFNPMPFPGDTDHSDNLEHFEATEIDEGRIYYVTVRVVYPDGALSAPSNEVMTAAGGRGEITLGMRYNAERDGFSFAGNDFVKADDLTNDIYYYNAAGSHFLASPIRLNGFLRNSRLYRFPVQGTLDDVRPVLDAYSGRPADDRVEISSGDWVLVRTDNNTHALVNVRSVVGSGPDALVELWYAYCSIPQLLLF